jgi:putative ABC transport system substrate-binding protein
MKRREFIAGLGVAGWPILVRAQRQTKPTIGVLGVLPEYLEAIRRGLADVGFFEGRDVTIEYRPGSFERLPALAADLVRQRPAAIVAPYSHLSIGCQSGDARHSDHFCSS